jgi:hypothetical protein
VETAPASRPIDPGGRDQGAQSDGCAWTKKIRAVLAMAKAQAFPTSVGDPAAVNDYSMPVDESTCPFIGKKRNCIGDVTC